MYTHSDNFSTTKPKFAHAHWVNMEEIEGALKILKLGKSGGPDGLSPQHIVYGGEVLKILWLKKIFNCILTLEEVP